MKNLLKYRLFYTTSSTPKSETSNEQKCKKILKFQYFLNNSKPINTKRSAINPIDTLDFVVNISLSFQFLNLLNKHLNYRL